jgi:hypothetical protein
MKEELLHYIWKYKKFDFSNLKTVQGEEVVLLHSGQHWQHSGPDFFNAQLIIGNQKWAGNVEIHLKASDWYIHHHQDDKAYENVILHVVWEYDVPVFRPNELEIPVLELKWYVSQESIYDYQELMTVKSWINCEKQIGSLDGFSIKNWLERLYVERLERKSETIFQLLVSSQNDWEYVLFCSLCKNFGLHINGTAFESMAKSLPFSVIRKECGDVVTLEALFLGSIGLLQESKEDTYYKELLSRWNFLKDKYRFENGVVERVEFFKHRPDNFPTIRLAQLAQLYFSLPNLFSKLLAIQETQQLYELFLISVSKYWQTHYVFDKESSYKRKALTKSFIDLLLINTVLPIRYAYEKSQGKEEIDFILDVLQQIPAERNSIIDKFQYFGVSVKNAFESQALLQLKREYCDLQKCLQCAIGMHCIHY